MNIIKIREDCQDRNSVAWKKLCEYVTIVAEEGRIEFSPAEYLGRDLFAQIYTLPETIASMKSVRRMWLYGSNLRRIPPEIGQMTELEHFDPYTSYSLRWFPFEITYCKQLTTSRISTRAVFGNYKNRKPFPDLKDNPARYFGDKVRCSVCKKELTYNEVNQLWITLDVGTDTLPLLANLCSDECERNLPAPPVGYIPYAHKGGPDLKQTGLNAILNEWNDKQSKKYRKSIQPAQSKKSEKTPLLKLIWKNWTK